MLFEEARWDMITSRGYGLSEVQKNQIGTVVLECTLRFMKELKLRERITIETKVSKITRKTLTIHHRIQNENGESAAESEFKMGCFDLKKRRLLSPTENWMQALTGIQR
jgi:YbgC/YbaW family acyl-CoA thioester hydrolase